MRYIDKMYLFFFLGVVGLENLGNTCFMNSCLQCLLNTTPLAAYFLEEAHLNETNPKSQSGGRFAGAFGEFMQDYWSTRSQGIAKAPRQLKKVIGKFARQFSGFAQHDAQEVSHDDFLFSLFLPFLPLPFFCFCFCFRLRLRLLLFASFCPASHASTQQY